MANRAVKQPRTPSAPAEFGWFGGRGRRSADPQCATRADPVSCLPGSSSRRARLSALIVWPPEVGKFENSSEWADGDSLVSCWSSASSWTFSGQRADGSPGAMAAVRRQVRRALAIVIGHTNGAGGMTKLTFCVLTSGLPCGGRYRGPSVNTIGEAAQ